MKLSLLVLTAGKQEGKTLEIKLPQFLIGRDPQCHLRPASALISKRHCVLIQRDEKAFIRDFDSTNGTFVNEEPVKGERELHNDDHLKIGPIEFTVRIEAGVAPSSLTPPPPTKAAAATAIKPAVGKPAAAGTTGDSTPPPATTGTEAAAAAKDDSAEDDIAAMLLSLEGDDAGANKPVDASGVPEGSTVMELKLPPEVGGEQANKDEKKAATPPKGASGDTRSAAASILEKMMKRPRT
jgi:pSer/pThr/pTyr-binding forkhead associated (FHA) protein